MIFEILIWTLGQAGVLLHLSQILGYLKKMKHQKLVFFTNLENIINPDILR
jgi:hypothetical protein